MSKGEIIGYIIGAVQIKNRTLNMKLHYYCYDDKEIYEPKPRF